MRKGVCGSWKVCSLGMLELPVGQRRASGPLGSVHGRAVFKPVCIIADWHVAGSSAQGRHVSP